MHRVIRFSLLATLATVVPVLAGEEAPSRLIPPTADEEVFDIAKHYTVKVRTQVELPFYGDKKGTAIGAGFVVDPARGWIMTNAHVVSRSPSKVSLSFFGGEYVPATKLYVDPYIDLALLEVAKDKRPAKLNGAQLDCNKQPAIGHAVGAFGHPWDLSYTGTRGIISGITGKFSGQLEMLQTDAPINPGNSGGPLISLKSGKVVGVNTASRKSSQNTNFAVPMVQACRVLALLRAGKDPSPPELSFAFYRDVDESNRLVVAHVYPDNGHLQLEAGDVIRAVEGESESVANKGRLLHLLRGRLDAATLSVERGSRQVAVRGSLKPAASLTARRGVYVSGILFAPMPWRDLGDLMNRRMGLMVHYVERGSAGDAHKIEQMDLLVALDNVPATTLEELHERLRAAQAAGRTVTLKLLRLGDMEENVFSYLERPLTPADLKLVGPAPAVAARIP
jgi:S1-C subfamily serine protease